MPNFINAKQMLLPKNYLYKKIADERYNVTKGKANGRGGVALLALAAASMTKEENQNWNVYKKKKDTSATRMAK